MDFIVVILLCGLVAYLILWFASRFTDSAKRRETARRQAEAKRLADCEEVVRYFANYYGYLARAAVNREELAEKIDTGISADDLQEFITRKMSEVDGIELGEGEDGISVILPREYRDKHIYVIGKSGYGKTSFLRNLIFQDMMNGAGIGVLAPEMEMLTEELLPFVPEHRIDDVVFFNPADLECPVVINPLHLEPGEDIDLHVDEAFTILQRVVGDGGPRMDEILRHSLYALTERTGSTLLDFGPLLDRNDDWFRRMIVRNTEDEQVRAFFNSVYPQFPKDAHLPIINRIGRIVRSRYVRNCLCPPKFTNLNPSEISDRLLNIRKAMDKGRILLFNLSDGILGEAASQLVGQFIVSKFQTATMSRADQAKERRRFFALYLDEFQNFCGVASKSYEKILSRARKYGLGMVLAHQQTGQIPLELLREILGNVSTLVSFQVSQADAARLAKEFINQYDFDIETVPAENLLRLNIGQAYCRIGKSSFPVRIPKIDLTPNHEIAERVIESSRRRYGIPRVTANGINGQSGQVKGGQNHLDDLDPEGVF